MSQVRLKELRSKVSENFCFVPFTTIILEPDGKVGICRNKGDNFPIGNIKNLPLQELFKIRNSKKAMQWRDEFINGNPVICADEVKYRKCHLEYGFNTLADQAELNQFQQGPILRLTANLNGKCNLRCPFCTVWQSPNGLYTDENFWNAAKIDLFPTLKEVDMLGGEPFIQADTYRLIKEIHKVNPSCQWFFTTNMAWKLTEEIKCHLDLIDINILTVSIDSLIPSTYERLRFPAKLEKTLDNFFGLKEYNDNRPKPFRLAMNVLFQKENILEFPEFVRFCLKYDIALNPILLKTPQHLSVLELDEEEKIKILNFYFNDLERKDLKLATPIIIPMINSLGPIERASFYSRLKN